MPSALRPPLRLLAGLLILAWSPSLASGQGLVAPGAGPINLSMAGASTATSVDFGSSYWNPATLSGLDRQEFLLGSQLIIPSIHLRTILPADSIGGTFPATGSSGTSRSNSGVASNLATGVAFRLSDDSPWTMGLGIFGLVGGGVNYAGSSSIPLLKARQPPTSFGFGPIYASTSVLEITPMVSYRANDKLSIGGGPIISSTAASFSPAFFAPGPKDAFGLPTFPSATNSRPFWGGGFQIGTLYHVNKNWNLGFSYKSPVWQERWSYNSSTPNGTARTIGLQASLPSILSWGVAYKGLPKTLIDVDLRYFDYADTSLFGQSISRGGLGWRSVFAVAVGGQYQLSDRITLRGGYLYNTNPIPSTATLFNVQAPGITQQTLSLGASMKLNENITVTGAWVHGFRNAVSGGISQVPGASTRFDVQTDSIVVGLNIQFGNPRKGSTPSSQPSEDIAILRPTVASEPRPLPPLPDANALPASSSMSASSSDRQLVAPL